jgi:alpha-D-ribose 1-methylphosphonate 5-triphosphate diphosphatase
MTMAALALANARLVLADEVIEPGFVVAENGAITDFGRGPPPAGAEDVGGDLVIPGLVELHTDHIEAHYMPRPKVHWDPVAAVVSYDAQLATSGITTVLDSLRVWREEGAEDVGGEAGVVGEESNTGRSSPRRSPRRAAPTCCGSAITCTCAARCRCRRSSRRLRR